MVAEQKLTAEQWFGTADQFLAGAFLMTRHAHENDEHFALPEVTCKAFASEAFLKSLLTIHGFEFPNEHDLRKLFRWLPDEDRDTIKPAWETRMIFQLRECAIHPVDGVKVPETFEQALKWSKDAFKVWRYNNTSRAHWWLGSFPVHVRDRIIDLRPAWRKSPPDFFGNFPKTQFGVTKLG